jgi:hypothetical protein
MSAERFASFSNRERAMNPFLLQIIEAVLEVLKTCPAPAAKRRAALRKPSVVQRVLVFSKCRRNGMKAKDFNANWEEAVALAKTASDAELDEFCAQAA